MLCGGARVVPGAGPSGGGDDPEGQREGGRKVVVGGLEPLAAGTEVFRRGDIRPFSAVSNSGRCSSCLRSPADSSTRLLEASAERLPGFQRAAGRNVGGGGNQRNNRKKAYAAGSAPAAKSIAELRAEAEAPPAIASTQALLRCGACGVTEYCSAACQRAAWGGVSAPLHDDGVVSVREPPHKAQCVLAKRFKQQQVIPAGAWLALAFFDACYAAKETQERDELRREVEVLEAHWADRTDADCSSLRKQAEFLLDRGDPKSFSRGELPQEQVRRDIDLMARLLGRINCNSFGVVSLNGVADGTLFDPAAAVFNHSCSPNCITVFEDRVTPRGAAFKAMSIRTVREVKPGEELTIAYIDVVDGTAIRKEQLKSKYFFECTCVRCEDSPENARHDAEVRSFTSFLLNVWGFVFC
jgi:SET domain/MYND finger